jgi:hypothetical protein
MARGQFGGFSNAVILVFSLLVISVYFTAFNSSNEIIQNTAGVSGLGQVMFGIIPFALIGVVALTMGINRS